MGGGGGDFIALLSPLCATGESSIKVCGLIKFTAVRLKRQLVLTAHLVDHVCGEGGSQQIKPPAWSSFIVYSVCVCLCYAVCVFKKR